MGIIINSIEEVPMPKEDITITHPSLKGKTTKLSPSASYGGWEVVEVNDAQEHTIDKEKVKAAMHWLRNCEEYQLKGFMKELGLQ